MYTIYVVRVLKATYNCTPLALPRPQVQILNSALRGSDMQLSAAAGGLPMLRTLLERLARVRKQQQHSPQHGLNQFGTKHASLTVGAKSRILMSIFEGADITVFLVHHENTCDH